MNKRFLTAASAVVFGLVTTGAPAFAAETEPTPINWSDCANLKDWTTPGDETAPTPTEDGLAFGDKANVYHPVSLGLSDITGGSFEIKDSTGPIKPLLKILTTKPFTTINQVTVDGQVKWWASAMDATQEGGQNKPVAKPSDLIGLDVKPGKTKLTDETVTTAFGVGFGNDTGSTALVPSLTFQGHAYDLTCKVAPTKPTATATATTSPSSPVGGNGTSSPSTSAVAGGAAQNPADGGSGLPVTGAAAGGIAGGAAVLLAVGAVLFVMARRRKVKFTA
jgi:hypothetical protein